MKPVGLIGTAVLSFLLAGAALAYAAQEQQGEKKGDKQGEKQDKPATQAKPKPEGAPAKPKPVQQDDKKPQPAQQGQPGQNDQQRQRAQQQQQEQQRQQQQRQQQQQQDRQQPQRGQQQSAPPPQQGARISQQQQQQLVTKQQQRVTQYRQDLDRQQRILQQQSTQLQQQRRASQYRLQQEYLERLRQQRLFLQNDRHDYDRDPYFFTAPIYRYSRDGHMFETNQYGADLLRQAMNFGYQEGFRAGEADRLDHWRSSYQDAAAYQDANYGYTGYYLDRDDYNYYFREGFRRGYEDGYSSRYQYGRYTNGSYSLLDAILSQVLGFQTIR